MSRSSRVRVAAPLVSVVALALVPAAPAGAASFGPFGQGRWGIYVLDDATPLTIDLARQRYCNNFDLSDGGERFTGFSDVPSAPGTCRTVVSAFTSSEVLTRPTGCVTDWRKGTVISDETVPVSQLPGPVTVAARPGTITRLCIFGLRTDGRWHSINGTRYISVGPLALDRPTMRVRRGSATVTCRQKKDLVNGPYLEEVKVTLRAGRTKLVRTGGTKQQLDSKAIRPGVKVTAKCGAKGRVSSPGQRSDFPSGRAELKPYYVSPVATARVPR